MDQDMAESNFDEEEDEEEEVYVKPDRVRRPSIMRNAIYDGEVETELSNVLSDSEMIRRKRGFFHSLPTGCGNDMVLGSW
jgi:hypothetical protein